MSYTLEINYPMGTMSVLESLLAVSFSDFMKNVKEQESPIRGVFDDYTRREIVKTFQKCMDSIRFRDIESTSEYRFKSNSPLDQLIELSYSCDLENDLRKAFTLIGVNSVNFNIDSNYEYIRSVSNSDEMRNLKKLLQFTKLNINTI